MPWYIWIILILVVVIMVGRQNVKIRREKLLKKYNDEVLVERLMKRQFWQGQSKEQLIDSLGAPKAINEQILKTKKKEVYKYDKQGSNRFGLKIFLEDDVVVGWDNNN